MVPIVLTRPSAMLAALARSRPALPLARLALSRAIHLPTEASSRAAIVDAMLSQVAQGAEDAFYIVDVGAALDRLALWRRLLPEVEPFYAVKCCPDPMLLYALARAGIGFDCASMGEMRQLLEMGVPAERILYANPCKQASHLRFAARHGVGLSVFDSSAELHKHAALLPHADALLRIAVDDSSAACVMSCKYGAPLADARALLLEAQRLGVRVRGVSFHVGSGCTSPLAFVDAVARAADVFSAARSLGAPMDLLDVGGGFPGVDTPALSFAAIAAPLRRALHAHFPSGVRFLAEPGRFLAASTHTLAVNVIGRKPLPAAPPSAPSEMYFVNDGIYGSFNCVLYDHAHPSPRPLPTPSLADALAAPHTLASVWGPTCDGLDCVVQSTSLPRLPVGSWLYFEDMGAYTVAAGSSFNGMPPPSKLYLHALRHAAPLDPPRREAHAALQAATA